MGIKFANGAYATLASGINSSATSITLTTGQGARFPSLAGGDYFFATLIDTSNNLEIVKCTARSTDVLTVVRGQESTTARSFSAGDRIELRITAQSMLDAGAASLDGDRGDITVSSSGTVWTIDNGAVTAAKLASTLDLTGKTVTLPAGVGGKILQVVQTHYTSTFSSSSATLSDVSGFSASITPSSSSNKVLVMVTMYFGFTQDAYPYVILKRNGTSIGAGVNATGNQVNVFLSGPNVSGVNTSSEEYKYIPASKNFLDSPATTSALTYQIAFAQPWTGVPGYINRQDATNNEPYVSSTGSTITLMEVAG
jgi:hypothetical protein